MADVTSLAGRQRHVFGRCVAWSLAVAVLLLLLPGGAAAAPPPNDDFADAQEMTGLPAEATGSNVDATLEPDEPADGDRSIWFRWTAPRDGGVTLVIGGCAPPFQDSVQGSYILAVYLRSPVFGIVRIPQQTFRTTAGRDYWISVMSSRGQPADPDICLRVVPGPPNDEFAQATPLTGFQVSATQTPITEGAATREPGEPEHDPTISAPPVGSVWYSWTAPADRLVRLRVCGSFGLLAVYTGSRVDALTSVATRRARSRRCGGLGGASVTFSAAQSEVYRIAVTPTSGSSFQLLLGNQAAVIAGRTPAFLYTAFSGQVDNVKLGLTGSGAQRALLVEADGVTAANGCQADVAAGLLRCPIPGKAAVRVDIDLGDGNDAADVRLPGSVRRSEEDGLLRRVLGGNGDDMLAGSAGSYSSAYRWTGRLVLVGGPGADRFAGGPGNDRLDGGPGPDTIDPGNGSDSIDGGPGDDRVRSLDGASDKIDCQAGRDRARLDGIDLPHGCERRKLDGPARAVATSAHVTNDDGDSVEHLDIYVACPIDAKRGCRARVTPAVPGERRISQRLKLAAGQSDVATFFRFSEDRLVRRGVRVIVGTQRRGQTLKFADHLAVFDDRYYGE